MNKLIFAWIILTATATSFAKDVYVKSYTKHDGTVVQGHFRTSPDNTTQNNYSTKGNVNPYTGEEGSKANKSLRGYSTSSGTQECREYCTGGNFSTDGRWIPQECRIICQ